MTDIQAAVGREQLACECLAGTCARLTESERARDISILFPLYHQMTGAEQDRVASAPREALA
jgi:dTDP-4-amino-4,6-dideoxygalactose transaminase